MWKQGAQIESSEERPVRNNCGRFHRKSTPLEPDPYILYGLFLTLLASRFTIRRIYCFGRAAKGDIACCGHSGKHDAILAGLDRAVHQSRMFRAGALVAGG